MRFSLIALYLIIIVIELLAMLLDILFNHDFVEACIKEDDKVKLERFIEHAMSKSNQNLNKMRSETMDAIEFLKNSNEAISSLMEHFNKNDSSVIDVKDLLVETAKISLEKSIHDYKNRVGYTYEEGNASEDNVPSKSKPQEQELDFFNS